MKVYKRIGLALIGLIVFWSVAYANTTTSGGTKKGRRAENTVDIRQDKYPTANNLEFTVGLTGDPNLKINGWTISVSKFDSSTSARNGDQKVDAEAWDGIVNNGESVELYTKFWFNGECNEYHQSNTRWSLNASYTKAVPDYGWEVDPPQVHPTNPAIYIHKLTITNDDASEGFWITDIDTLASATYYPGLTGIPFPGNSIPPVYLAAGQTTELNIHTTGEWRSNFIYHAFTMRKDDGSGNPDYSPAALQLVNVGLHVVSPIIPTLSSWGLIILGLFLALAGVIVIRRLRKRTVAEMH